MAQEKQFEPISFVSIYRGSWMVLHIIENLIPFVYLLSSWKLLKPVRLIIPLNL